jgi:phage terminase small subunit
MRSAAQYERQKRLEMREQREKELAMIASAFNTADPRYVRDVAGWIWRRLFARKLQHREELPKVERQRLAQLIELEAVEEVHV